RKRSASVFSNSSSAAAALPPDAINPLSHSQSTLKQLRLAGLRETDLLPSTYIANFPHRPVLRRNSNKKNNRRHDDEDGHDNDSDSPAHCAHNSISTDDDDDDDNNNNNDDDNNDDNNNDKNNNNDKTRRAQAMREKQESQLGVLTQIILRALEEGDIPRAKRAFGLLRRSTVAGSKEVDLRRNGLWSLGAEVLMRDGERKWRTIGGGAKRWGSSANMPKLRIYLEGLIRSYPYNRLHPDAISDLDFYPVLFGCDFYNIWIEHKLALEKLVQDAETWSSSSQDDHGADDDRLLLHDVDDHFNTNSDDDDDRSTERLPLTPQDRRFLREKEALRQRAEGAMRAVETSMDTLLERMPYSRSVEMLRLRGMVALFLADLRVVPPLRPGDEKEQQRANQLARESEHEKARQFFIKMKEHGAPADPFVDRWLSASQGQDG
ncbi:hypothetical protein BD289DRAFT_350847, partial [Coniella lustricola]